MTAKEKAEELLNKFFDVEDSKGRSIIYFRLDAKQCALIAVDEILETFPKQWNGFEYESCDEFWQDVKQEILKL